MDSAQSTFISSTFWTERIGPSAALKTLEIMERLESWTTVTETGKLIRLGWQELADKHAIQISHWGLPALTGFTFESKNNLIYKTLITQEMLAKGFLASNSVYACIDHSPKIIQIYMNHLDRIFALIKQCEDGFDPMKLLHSPICQSGFKRLN